MAEHKVFITEVNANSFAPSGNVAALTTISQGQTSTTRIGTKVLGTSLEVMFSIAPSTVASPTATTIECRIVIFIWKDDTVPTQLTVYDPIIATVGNAGNIPHVPFNSDWRAKRKILYSENFVSNWQFQLVGGVVQGNVATPGLDMHRKLVIPLTKLKNRLNSIEFQPGMSTIGVNHIYMIMTSSDAPSAQNGRIMHMMTRYNYIDM